VKEIAEVVGSASEIPIMISQHAIVVLPE